MNEEVLLFIGFWSSPEVKSCLFLARINFAIELGIFVFDLSGLLFFKTGLGTSTIFLGVPIIFFN